MSDLKQGFLDAMSNVAATVTVVATDGPGGRSGVTVSAMSSVSADTEKPVLLVCVNEQGTGAAPIAANEVFSVNILKDNQTFVSDTFAGRYKNRIAEKFACASWDSGMTGAPILKGALASLDCRLLDSRKVGQHHVFFGEVEAVHLSQGGRPLIYANRSYGTPLSLPPLRGRGSAEGRLRLACLESFAPFYLPGLLLDMRRDFPDLQLDVIEGDQEQVARLVQTGEAQLGLLYDRDLPATVAASQLLSQEPYVLLAAGDEHGGQAEVSLADLGARPFVLLDQPTSRDFILNILHQHGITPPNIIRASTFEMARGLVATGLGYAILVTRPQSDVSYDGKPLVARRITEALPQISITLISDPASEQLVDGKRFQGAVRSYFSALSEPV